MIKLEQDLKKFSAKGIRLGLSRVRELAERLGNPQDQLKIIHVAGTNGKGSFGAMLASILTNAGYRTGHFASPALLGICDYFRIDQNCVSDRVLTQILPEVIHQAEQMQDQPTEFEILAVSAYLLFASQKCDFAVIECCIGGDSDCTNIIQNPLLSVITNIQKDHCTFLGNTLEEIARHKAGIIKQNCPVLTGEKNPEILQIIQNQSECLQADCYPVENFVLSADYHLTGTELKCREFGELHLALLGAYQPENANLVLHAVKILRKSGIVIPDQAIRDGFACCRWHGRFELISEKDPCVIFDGGHNPDGIRVLTESLQLYFRTKSVLIMGVMADKEYSRYAEMLQNYAEKILLVRPDHPRSLDPKYLQQALQTKIQEIQICESVSDALQTAVRIVPEDSQIICLGSLYLYQEFSDAMKKIL